MSETFDFSRRAMLGGALGLTAVGAIDGSASAASVPTDPASEFRLSMTSITGSGHMSVLTWSFGSTTPVNPLVAGSGNGASKAKPADLVVVKPMDQYSPLLHRACVSGKFIPTAVLTGTEQADTRYDYLSLELSKVAVSSYMSAPGEKDAFPLDVLHLKFTKIKQTFRSPPGGEGEPGTSVSFVFDYATNKVG